MNKSPVQLILRGLRLKAPFMSSLMFQVVGYYRAVRAAGYKMIGPDASKSQQYLLDKQGGKHLPEVENITVLDSK